MPDLPEFTNEDDMIEWFENADLGAMDLQDALEVRVAPSVSLTLAEPWVITPVSSAGVQAYSDELRVAVG